MIEIKCSKAQFKRILFALENSAMQDDKRCIMGKTYYTCPSINGVNYSCHECIAKNVRRVE